ncbi:MAG: DUF1616 domain-containing protein [archaeon]|nr:DUF1616 domain-containing protein [archaeon]
MDSDDSVLNAIIIACVIGIAVVAFLILTTERDESFTELYFLNYTKAPANDTLFVRLGINNHENCGMDYNVVVLVDDETIMDKVVSVPDNGDYIGHLDIPFTLSGVHKVTVMLFGREEEIHFWTE